uniref:Uncharacterized protein n=1 Tax=Gopherus evgoodei TaxID=1825980 RepID=A0A8C4VFY3_9SAUR
MGKRLRFGIIAGRPKGVSLFDILGFGYKLALCFEAVDGTGKELGYIPLEACDQTLRFSIRNGTFYPLKIGVDTQRPPCQFQKAYIAKLTGEHYQGEWFPSLLSLGPINETHAYYMYVSAGILSLHSSLIKSSECQGALVSFTSHLFAVTYCGYILNTHAMGHLNASHWGCWGQVFGNSKHRDVRVDWHHRVAGSSLTLYLQSPGLYFICGHNAYKALPPGWHGRCGVARILPDIQVNTTLDSHQILNLGTYSHKLFTPLKGAGVKRAENPLVIRQTGFHSFIRGLIPGLGVAEVERAMVNISAELEKAANASSDAFQKRVLDAMNAEGGEACACIGERCCFYINRSDLIEEDLQAISHAAVVFHTVSLDHTLNFEDLLPDLGSWFTGLFRKIVKWIIFSLFFLCAVWVVLQCAKCLCSAVTKGSTVHKRTQYLSLQDLITSSLALGTFRKMEGFHLIKCEIM